MRSTGGRPRRRSASRLESTPGANPVTSSAQLSISKVAAGATGRRFEAVSAVTSGVADIKRILEGARRSLRLEGRGTILFIDEIHRFNKSQQDALLHGVEDGTLTQQQADAVVERLEEAREESGHDGPRGKHFGPPGHTRRRPE